MDTTTQLVLVSIVVAAAALFVLRATWKTWFRKSASACGSGCGKCATPEAEPKQDGRFPLPQA
jgi:FeoB-associated Cys-rich membrane protein